MTYDLTKKETKKATKIHSQSCVGILQKHMKYPLHYGNYFYLETEDGNAYEIVNFWAEDLIHLIDNKIVDFPLNIKILEGRFAVLYDSKIPEDFYSDTSYRAPEKYWSVTKRVNKQLKIDSEEIHILGGAEVTNSPKLLEFKIEKKDIKAGNRKLKVKFTMEPEKELDNLYNLDIRKLLEEY
jgi:hypothetical protein